MNRLAITAEGPSSDIMNRRENPTGYTYLAPHEPARFIPFDPEITARAMRHAFEPLAERDELRAQLETARWDGWKECLDSVRSSIRNYPNQGGDIVIMQAIEGIINAQLETARKMFEAIIKTDGKYAIRQSQIALAQIGAGQKGGK